MAESSGSLHGQEGEQSYLKHARRVGPGEVRRVGPDEFKDVLQDLQDPSEGDNPADASGDREPHKPKPTADAGSVALEEPRTEQ